TLPILVGLDGVRRMGKSLGNYVGVGEPAQVQFDKTMSLSDALMKQWFELLTDRPVEEIARLTDPATTHPREPKLTLAGDIVTFYRGTEAMAAARAEWVHKRTEGEDPTDIPEAPLPASELTDGKIWICKLLVLLKVAESNSEGRRAVEGKAVRIGPDKE